jgi:hypothetical protein
VSRNILPYRDRSRAYPWEPLCGWTSLAPGGVALLLMLAVSFGRFQLSFHLNGLILVAVTLAIGSGGSWPGLAGFGMAALAFLMEIFVLLMTAAITGR